MTQQEGKLPWLCQKVGASTHIGGIRPRWEQGKFGLQTNGNDNHLFFNHLVAKCGILYFGQFLASNKSGVSKQLEVRKCK